MCHSFWLELILLFSSCDQFFSTVDYVVVTRSTTAQQVVSELQPKLKNSPTYTLFKVNVLTSLSLLDERNIFLLNGISYFVLARSVGVSIVKM